MSQPDFAVYIPTLGRVNMQYTLSELAFTDAKVVLVTSYEEYEAHKKLGRQVIGTPEGLKGISNTRQWIMENVPERYVVMMDDDLTFSARRTDDPTKFHEPMSHQYGDMLSILRHMLQYTYVHVGVSMREGANRDIAAIRETTRMCRVIGYDRLKFLELGIDFRHSTVMDDFEATLQLLTKGHKNGVLNSFVQNQKGSGTLGGASLYRTLEVHKQAALTLEQRYPQYVTAVEKTTKTAWGGATRTDVRVQWKKAYEESKNGH